MRADCDPARVDLRWDGGRAAFRVEVADDARERSRGLMQRKSLPRFGGMLFVYSAPEPVTFWMEDTLIPLDMLFFDATGTVVNIHPNAIPMDRSTIFGGEAIQFVLEINGGLAADLGLPVGAQMRYPAVDRALAAWSCEDSG